ncbi:MAG: methyltransferase domain-containing protein [Nocardioidaceae bacterium]
MTTYTLGSDDPEIARLNQQALFLAAPTRVLLAASGIAAGMQVLDLGTGLGHVALAAADLVGPTGTVVGVDNDPKMIDLASRLAQGRANVRFVEGDVHGWSSHDSFDVVVGRLILFHLADPITAIRNSLRVVQPGGRAVFLDYDIGALRAEPPEPLTTRMVELTMQAFRAAGADPTIGARLRALLAEAGLVDVGGFGIVSYLGEDEPIGSAMFAGVIRSLAPVITGRGLASLEELDLDSLSDRIAAAMQETHAVIVPPVLAGAWGRRP